MPPAGGFGAPPATPYAPAPFGPTPGYSPAHAGSHAHGVQWVGEGPITNGAPSLRWWILGSFVAAIAFVMLGAIVGDATRGDETAEGTGRILTLIGFSSVAVYCVTVLVWIYKSWEMLPPAMRVTDGGKHVSPGMAVACLFIPFYNLYWQFVVSVGLCNALNRALAAHGSSKRASTGLATAAAVLQLLPYVSMFAPLLWIPFVFNVESAKREYVRVASRPPV